MTVVLWHIEVSHYNEKARWALDHKRIPYELRTPQPGMHRVTAARLTRGRHSRLPVLGLDGRRVGDSTAIIAALERYKPVPALYPADPTERRRALGLEDYFDEQLAPRVRRLFWHYTLADPDAALGAAMPGAGSIRRALLRRGAPLASAIVSRDYGADQAGADEAVEGIRGAMDRLETELADGDYLVGDGFTVADLAGAALFTPLLAPPERPYAPALVTPLHEVRDELEARRGGAWVAEMYARHRGTPITAA